MDIPAQTRWHVVIPVKDTRVGKSRLTPLAGLERQRLSIAIAQDTIVATVAAVGPAHVVLVTSDPVLSRRWSGRVGTVLPDPGAGLNAAARAGRLAVPGAPGACAAVLLGDLPALRPDDLRVALRTAEKHEAAFVPDAEGAGTVLLCGTVPPSFGPASAAAHAAQGAVRLELERPGLRRDVDDAVSLREAHELGVGPATRAVLERLWQLDAMGRQ